MQSVNEELLTDNAELQTKVAELSRANNDMNNLLAGTGIATLFLDPDLNILRFTPAASGIIKLIPGDVGRPVSDIASNLIGYDSLVADARAVLETLAPRELEVQSTTGKWYALRILPYRTIDNVVEGAVISFVDITLLVRARESLRRLAVVVRDAHDAITVQDLYGRTLAWNPGAQRMYGWSEAEALALNVRDRVPEAQREQALSMLLRLGQDEILAPYRSERLAKDGTVLQVWVTATALLDQHGQVYAVATTERRRNHEQQG